jgi:hypothetical protein
MSSEDETLTRITAAVELGRAGRRAEAREALSGIWTGIGPGGDAFHRCTLAHYMADLQDADEDELWWDEQALAAVADLTDERAQRVHESLQVRGFLPSLHLNLADDHRRLGDTARAREHLATARELSAVLPDDGYGSLVRRGIENVTAALDAGSAARLETH